uniref:Regucalcin n=1 Tax=Suberites domuncula TaxID=55567 RepID=C7BUE1_SUBDO|nr:luciferin-regenerating enzyme [Suberites domuncula]
MEKSGLNPSPTVELLYDGKAEIGEGPFFEPETNQLLWVDIYKCTINFLNLATIENRSMQLPEKVGFVIPVEGSSNLLAGIGTKLCLVNRETGDIVEELACVDGDKPNRFNDAKCDANGRLWAGTMALAAGPSGLSKNEGTLYSFVAGKVTPCVPGVTISNGLGWSLDNSKMYYIDSIPQKVYSFDYNFADGTIANQKTFVDYVSDDSSGFPDGMCTDIEGRLWVASFGGGCVTCWDSKTGDKLARLDIPGAKNITSCCFGGPDHSWLFVTCGSAHVEDLSKEPNAGGIFVVKDSGTKGLPANRFKC